MKKTLFIAALAAVAVLTGCQKESGNGDMTNGKAISFRTLTDKTRAVVMNGANIGSFKVSAVAGTEIYMDGINVTREPNGSATWTYNPIKYWPASGTVDFYAYSPAGSVNVNSITNTATSSTIAYTVPELTPPGPKIAEDFLVAVNKGASGPGAVALTFEHALSNIEYMAKNVSVGATYHIRSLSLINIANEGTIDLAVSPLAWNVTGTKDRMYIYAPIAAGGMSVLPKGPSADYEYLYQPGEGIMVLPQTITPGSGTDANNDGVPEDSATAGKGYVCIGYSVTDQVGGVIRPNMTAYYPLDITFEPTKRYQFQFTLGDTSGPTGLDPITFTVATVNGWAAGSTEQF